MGRPVTARKAVFDTNLYVDWLRGRDREELFLSRSLQRHLCAVVWMELRAGARTPKAQRDVARVAAVHQSTGRLCAPSPSTFERAGHCLQALRLAGRDVARASLLNDLLIAMMARELGAVLYTRDRDFEAIREVEGFALEIVP